MTDKELKEWEQEAEEAEKDIRKMYKTLGIVMIIGSILYIISNAF